jgi:hypothetical protein
VLLTNGEWLDLEDYFWSAGTYEKVLTEAGFIDLRTEAPLLADTYGLADPDAWNYEVERTRPPLLLIHGHRQGSR